MPVPPGYYAQAGIDTGVSCLLMQIMHHDTDADISINIFNTTDRLSYDNTNATERDGYARIVTGSEF